MSRDIPVIFSALMIRALLAGRKTMTRRLAWANKIVCDPKNGHFLRTEARPSTWRKAEPGDRLWVRESLTCVGDGKWRYKADDRHVTLSAGDPRVSEMIAWAHHKEQGYAPSIHMPRWASRITLVVTEAKVERLQDISEEDATAEGWQRKVTAECQPSEVHRDAARDWFSDLWESLHGVESWRSNPEVVALRFEVQTRNIDSMAEAA